MLKKFASGCRSCSIVFAGGALGTLVRHFMSTLVDGSSWIGILTVNVIATFVAGVVSVAISNERARLFLMTGFLGGFSTLAAVEIWALADNNPVGLFYIPITFALCLLSCFAGARITGGARWHDTKEHIGE